ncbi:MAG: glycosyltransferase [Saprospiraceae bacterium]|nr:glycosyltransferase [Saprospiraceae bacterium]MDW8483181.1 glycosyltransferase [Saprospiraceae bacterium]
MRLQVVSFDIPWPANYGGAITVFHQLRALHEAGARIVLHCFQYGNRKQAEELNKYCETVYYYPRSRSLWHQWSFEPFIVQTRKNKLLLQRLVEEEAPILFEGLHTAGWLAHPALRNRRKVLRMHNIEWQYYAQLGRSAASHWQRLYFWVESFRLKRAEARLLPHADSILAFSTAERDYFARRYSAQAHYLPVFHPFEEVSSLLGKGVYALFHGKLSVPDNERAVIWLLEEVFAYMPDVPFTIAGMAPSKRLRSAIARFPNAVLIADPDQEHMDALIQHAQVHVIPSFQSSGVKLKLLNALFRGRHCVANMHTLAGTYLHSLCYVAEQATQMRRAVQVAMETPFTADHLLRRKFFLEKHYSNRENARRLVAILAGQCELSAISSV